MKKETGVCELTKMIKDTDLEKKVLMCILIYILLNLF
jgi:hypothetical protein